MDSFLWWSGAIAWGVLGVVGLNAIADWIIELTIGSFWTKREFLAFVADRLRKAP